VTPIFFLKDFPEKASFNWRFTTFHPILSDWEEQHFSVCQETFYIYLYKEMRVANMQL